MKQRITFISIILIISEIICLFLPYSFLRKIYDYDTNSSTFHGSSTLSSKLNVNIFDVDNSKGLGNVLAIIVLITMILSLFAFLITFLKKNTIFEKFYFYTPIASFIFLIIFTEYAIKYAMLDETNYRLEWDINWLFYIIITLHIFTILFCIILRFKKFENVILQLTSKKETKENNDSLSTADELIKYKELLDSGVITQEEFDAKKKQLFEL